MLSHQPTIYENAMFTIDLGTIILIVAIARFAPQIYISVKVKTHRCG
jgi:hypothetical protein